VCGALCEDRAAGVGRYTLRHNLTGGKLIYGLHSGEALDVITVMLPEALLALPRLHYVRGITKTKALWESGPASAMVQGAIIAEHSALYSSNRLHSMQLISHEPSIVHGEIADAKEFMRLIKNGRDAIGQVAFFTYVIDLNGRWCFCRTGCSKIGDVLSKHVVHNKGRRELLYAGEFHIAKDGKLIVDNNSGTYGPSPVVLQRVARVIERAIPGLRVEGWEQDDPRLLRAIAKSPTRCPPKEREEMLLRASQMIIDREEQDAHAAQAAIAAAAAFHDTRSCSWNSWNLSSSEPWICQ